MVKTHPFAAQITQLSITSCWVVLLLFLPTHVFSNNLIQFDFHGASVTLDYDPAMLLDQQLIVEELALRQSYDRLSHRPYQSRLESLQSVGRELDLNDWLYYELIKESLQRLYRTAHQPEAELTAYLLLAKSGYDVRLTYRRQELFVNVFTEDILYEIPLIREDGRQYANLSSVNRENESEQSMFLLNHRPQVAGRPFTFRLEAWPAFPREHRTRTLAFQYNRQIIEIDIHYDGSLAQLMETYPLIDEHWYLEAPPSPILAASLLPQFRRLLEGKTQREALEILVSFTRSAFNYKEDRYIFGGSKPMVPDEVFFYPFSDCEDRAALFYCLVKELLQLPMIVIAFEDHLSIAVAAPDVLGDGIRFQGQRYVFCDPTGPSTSSEIGVVPEGYERARYEIIGSYR